jgi:hypothetical protein
MVGAGAGNRRFFLWNPEPEPRQNGTVPQHKYRSRCSNLSQTVQLSEPENTATPDQMV